jgi:hypothetical protein
LRERRYLHLHLHLLRSCEGTAKWELDVIMAHGFGLIEACGLGQDAIIGWAAVG